MENTPYDYFLINLKMIEAMVLKMKKNGAHTTNAVHLQVALLKDMIGSLTTLMEDLTELEEEKN